MIVRLAAGTALIRAALSTENTERCCGIRQDTESDWFLYTTEGNTDVLWEGTDEPNFYCNSYDPETDDTVRCACLNSGTFPDFDDALVWDTTFSLDVFQQILDPNSEMPYPNCIELEQAYWDNKLNSLATEEYLTSDEYLAQDNALKTTYAQK
jgi:hypothetical protein